LQLRTTGLISLPLQNRQEMLQRSSQLKLLIRTGIKQDALHKRAGGATPFGFQ
jgi:hypothetical protein